jgi:DNA repair protein RecN (Recombination protein N)
VAAFAERHYRIEKVDVAGQTVTRLALLDEDAALAELSRMMGGEEGDPGALAHARALRKRAMGAAE